MHLCSVKTVIWQICSNRPEKKVPQSARLSAGGGGGAKAIRAMPKCPLHEFEEGFPYIYVLYSEHTEGIPARRNDQGISLLIAFGVFEGHLS